MDARLLVKELAVLALALWTTTAAAQGAGAAVPSSPGQDRPQRASRIIGMDVISPQGEKVGDIEDIVIDRHGNAVYAIVSTGGFLGVGEKLHAVPWHALQPNASREGFRLDVDRKRLARAPGFDANNFPDLHDPKWSAENRRHFPAASRSKTTGRDTGPNPPPRTERSRDGATGPGSRPAGNDIGPAGATTERTGNSAAGSASADDSHSTQ